MMQDQKLLTLHGPSSLGGGRAIVAAIYTHKRGQHFYYSLLSLNSCLIVLDARTNIIDTPLMLIFAP